MPLLTGSQSATVAGVLPFSSIKLAVYDLLRRHETEGVDDSSKSLSMGQAALFGAVAGSVAVCAPSSPAALTCLSRLIEH